MTCKTGNFLPYNPRLRSLARTLRKQGTLGEALLWRAIKGAVLGCEFHRQVPIAEYIVDFFSPALMLAVEVDGSGHDHAEIWMQDQKRQAELERLGVRFLRFQEVEVRSNLEGVVETLRDWIEQEKCGEGHPP